MDKRIVLSGGPGTGKTSIIQALHKKGYTVYPEVSRAIIQDSLSTQSSVLPWKDLMAFSTKVMNQRFIDFIEGKKLCFYDRSLIDTLAYLKHAGIDIPPKWHERAKRNKYFPKVFLTPPWEEIYTQDEERKESFEEVVALHNILKEMYTSYGYECLEIPQGSVEERVAFIRKKLRLK